MMSRQQTAFSISRWYWLFLPILVALSFRVTGLAWDDGFMLHPDERFLVQVMNAMQLPDSINHYLDPASSSYNPTNRGHSFFVYGTLPIVVTKTAAIMLDMDSPGQLLRLGRIFSVAVDIVAVVMVWLLSSQFKSILKVGRFFPLLSALFYALSVLPIQLAHFFTVDSFMSSAVIVACVCSVYGRRRRSVQRAIFAGMFMALALACKIQAVVALPLVVGLLIYRTVCTTWSNGLRQLVGNIPIIVLIFLLSTYGCLRIAGPYYFQSVSWLHPALNEKWLTSIHSLLQLSGPDVWYPPAIQWISTAPVLFALANMVKYGLGPVCAFLAVIGTCLVLCRDRHPLMLLVVIWGGLFFLYQSSQFVKALRYFILLYPWLAILAAYAMDWLIGKGAVPVDQQQTREPLPRVHRGVQFTGMLMLLLVPVWPLLFLNIYVQPHTRVVASQWIYDNFPDNSRILYEYWDDRLPLQLDLKTEKRFVYEKLEVFAKDSEEKMVAIREAMGKADFYILSSNRAWGSIPKVPWKYPEMSKYYDDLFSGRLGYEKVAEFVRHPSLEWLGLPLSVNDESADETFTVYDHPKVIIMKRVL